MTARQSHARIQAVITGKAKVAGPIEAHEKNVLAITRHIHKLEAKISTLSRDLKEARAQRRERKRELRVVLQRDSSINVDDERLAAAAGQADAVDAVNARLERRS